ncbi:MAG TPA: energy transducer TonB [Treponema sp.]|nr:energy transducer TonB [Treponema sp.]
MANEKIMRLALFAAVAALHILLIFFLAFNVRSPVQSVEENARVMKLVDLEEEPPPPPPPPPEPEPEETPQVESIAETMIETEVVPEQTIVEPGTLSVQTDPWDDYLPQFRLSVPPKFNEKDLAAALVYPSIAQRSGVEGRVILELFVDKNGNVQQILILQETPQGRGFAEAAVRAFTGLKCAPALANGEPVSCRYRYPVRFALR